LPNNWSNRFSSIYSQLKRVTDRQTDRQTDGRTNRRKSDLNSGAYNVTLAKNHPCALAAVLAAMEKPHLVLCFNFKHSQNRKWL